MLPKKADGKPKRRERVYSRSKRFCGEKNLEGGRTAIMPQAKNKPEQSGLCSDVSTGYEKNPLMVVLYNKKQPATHYELPTAGL